MEKSTEWTECGTSDRAERKQCKVSEGLIFKGSLHGKLAGARRGPLDSAPKQISLFMSTAIKTSAGCTEILVRGTEGGANVFGLEAAGTGLAQQGS